MIRLAFLHQLQGFLNVGIFLADVPILQEKPHLDAVLLQQAGGGFDGLDALALVHRVEDLLRAGFHPQPDLVAAGAGQFPGAFRGDQVGAVLALVGNAHLQPLQLVGKLGQPARFKTEDVIGNPDVISFQGAGDQSKLLRCPFRRHRFIAAAVERLSAPVAGIRAAV